MTEYTPTDHGEQTDRVQRILSISFIEGVVRRRTKYDISLTTDIGYVEKNDHEATLENVGVKIKAYQYMYADNGVIFHCDFQ